jgi:hypothetical protein
MEKMLKYGERINEFLIETRQAYEDYEETHRNVKESVAGFFREVREAVDREEENVLSRIRESHQ